MAYIGNQPTVGNFVKLDAIVTSATATYNLLNGGVAYTPASVLNLIVSLNGVIQEPTTASNVGGFTVSGSTIVFTSALTSLDVIDFILVLGDVLNIGTPSDGTVTFPKVTSNLITGATAETSIAGGDSVLIYDDSATALRKMTRTNFVAGIGGTNTPAFSAYSASGQSFNQDTHTVAQFDTELFDTNSCYDTSTYKFTPNVSGKYVIGSDFMIEKDAAELKVALLRIRKNGSTIKEVRIDIRNSTGKQFGPNVIALASANGTTDYFDITIYSDSTEANAFMSGASTGSIFYGYKIIE